MFHRHPVKREDTVTHCEDGKLLLSRGLHCYYYCLVGVAPWCQTPPLPVPSSPHRGWSHWG